MILAFTGNSFLLPLSSVRDSLNNSIGLPTHRAQYSLFGLKPNLPDLSGLAPFITFYQNQSHRLAKQVTHMVHEEFLAGCQPRQA